MEENVSLPAELRVLEYLTEKIPRNNTISMAELKDGLNIPHSSLNRALNSLLSSGYLFRVRRGSYTLGPAALTLGSRLLESSLASSYGQLLERLRDITGLNAELYSITSAGPLFLSWSGGKSNFNVRMYPGHQIRGSKNPAGIAFLAAFPDSPVWGLDPFETFPDGETSIQAAAIYREQGYYFETGRVLPELARIVLATPSSRFCIGISGLISEFPADIHTIINSVKEEIDENNIFGDG